MQNVWTYISFVLGVISALGLQWVSYRLSFKKDIRREYWIRKLNSYQDFYHHASQLIELLDLEINLPESVFWQSISLTRKAAFDAVFYDGVHPSRTEEMKNISLNLIRLFASKDCSRSKLQKLREQIEKIRAEFYKEETLLVVKFHEDYNRQKMLNNRR